MPTETVNKTEDTMRTPGDWTAADNPLRVTADDCPKHSTGCCLSIAYYSFGHSPETQLANMKLMAQAPALVRLCKELTEALRPPEAANKTEDTISPGYDGHQSTRTRIHLKAVRILKEIDEYPTEETKAQDWMDRLKTPF